MTERNSQQDISKQRLLDAVFERSALGIAIFDLGGRLVFSNHAYSWMLGISGEKLRGMHISQLLSREIFSASADEFARLTAGEAARLEYDGHFIRQDGTSGRYRMTFTLSRDQSGEPEYVVLIADDATQQPRDKDLQQIIYNISAAVSESSDLSDLIRSIQQELGKIMDTSNFYVALHNRKNNSLILPYFSDDKDEFKEYPAEKTLSGYVIHSGTSLFGTREKIAALEKTGEIELVGSDCMIWLGVPLRVRDEIIGMLGIQSYTDENAFSPDDLSMLEFVSNQIGISIEKKRAEDELRIERVFFKQIFENIAEAIIIGKRDGTIWTVNKGFTDLFGYTYEESVGGNINDMIVPSEFLEESFELRNRIARSEIFLVNTRRMRKDGTYVDVSLLGSPFNIDNEEYNCVIYRDIRKQIETEAMLKAAKERAEESDRLKTAFLANMSHEIRTPMNAIIGFVELLSLPDLSDDEKHEYINVINNSGKILLNLIDDIIDLAKIEADQLKIQLEDCDLNQLLQEVYTQYREQLKMLGKEKIELRLMPGRKGETWIRTDPFRLRQIFHNLVGNAIKFTTEGYVEFGYRLTDENLYEFYVKDTGIGIPGDKKELIFNRFLQVDNSGTRKYGGTGLGLTISRRLSQLLGGNMWLVSEPDKGSTFYFHVQILDPAREEKKISEPDYHIDPQRWKNRKILIVEDNSVNYMLLAEILKETGAGLLWAETAEEAIERVRSEQGISLVLMDIQMPGISGYEATRMIKDIRGDLPVIAQTAYAMSDERERAMVSGCDDYLTKPIRPLELIAILNKHLR